MIVMRIKENSTRRTTTSSQKKFVLELLCRVYVSSFPPVYDLCFVVDETFGDFQLSSTFNTISTSLNLSSLSSCSLSQVLENAPVEETWLRELHRLSLSESDYFLLLKWVQFEGLARICSSLVVEKSLDQTKSNLNSDKDTDVLSEQLRDYVLWHGPFKFSKRKLSLRQDVLRREMSVETRRRSDRDRFRKELETFQSPRREDIDLPVFDKGEKFVEKVYLLEKNLTELVPPFKGVTQQRIKYLAEVEVIQKDNRVKVVTVGFFDSAVEAAFAHDFALLYQRPDVPVHELNFTFTFLTSVVKQLPNLKLFWEKELQI